jgi:uncharacterized protein (TIGR00369 family)
MTQELSKERRDFLTKDFARGFVKFCGIEAVQIERGFFHSRGVIKEHHQTQDGFIHAGLIATMSDHTAGYAAYTLVDETSRILTVEFKINFLKPAHGTMLHCKSTIVSQGKQIIVAQSSVFDIRQSQENTQEKMVSRSTVTLMVVDAARLSG